MFGNFSFALSFSKRKRIAFGATNNTFINPINKYVANKVAAASAEMQALKAKQKRSEAERPMSASAELLGRCQLC